MSGYGCREPMPVSGSSRLLNILESEQVPIKEVNVAETASDGEQSRASFVISTQNIYGWEQIKTALINKIGPGIEFDTDLAALFSDRRRIKPQ